MSYITFLYPNFLFWLVYIAKLPSDFLSLPKKFQLFPRPPP